MIIRRIENKWLVLNYNYLALLEVTEELGSEWQVHDYFRNSVQSYCENGCTSNKPHTLSAFIDAKMIPSVLNTVKIALWEGELEQRVTAHNDAMTDTVIIRIDSSFMVYVEKLYGEESVGIIDPISLDNLEFLENDEVQAIIHGISGDNVVQECIDKANRLRDSANNKHMLDNLNNCDLTLMGDEDLAWLLSK